ncbi:MAG TPA: DUF2339 domain-containing protein [Stenotrophomonas sp.]
METVIVLVGLGLLVVPVMLVIALVWLAGLRRRVTVLERELDEWRRQSVASRPPVQPGPAFAAALEPVPAPAPVPAYPRETWREPAVATTADESVPDRPVPPPIPAERRVATPPPSPQPVERSPGIGDRWVASVKRWFTEGNVPVKVGMLVLLAGVASLLKYASDQGWLTLPVPLRLAAISAAALAALVFGWRQRAARPAFALALQGGAIGVLLLVLFAACKLYPLIPVWAAFGLSVVLVAGLCVLAVLQDSRTLAVLGILAGFLAPIWLSTGTGNHVALFSYYALLNAGVFAIAWVRPWRVLNLLGFAFTFGIGTLWGVTSYRPEHFASTEPFLLLFFAIYVAVPILHARRSGLSPAAVVDGSLVFGTPLAAFALQAALLPDDTLRLALCALAVATMYALLAAWLVRKPATHLLGQAHAVLAVGFATLAVPLALSARVTASVFALEGAGLVWLGLQQSRRLPQVAGVLLQLGAAVAFAIGAGELDTDQHAFANPGFLGASLLALAGLVTAWLYRRAGRSGVALSAYLWGLAWAWAALHLDIHRFAPSASQPDGWLVALALLAWAAAEAHRRWPSMALAGTTLAAFAFALPVTLWQVDAHGAPFAGWGALAWPLFALAGARALWALRAGGGATGRAAQFAWWLLWPFVAMCALGWLAQRQQLASGWRWAMWLAPWWSVAALALWRWRWLAWPQGEAFARLRQPWLATVFGLLALAWWPSLFSPLPAAPLPWMPVLNPGELTQLVVLALLARWWLREPVATPLQRWYVPALSVAAWAWITSATLRSVHAWGAVPWNADLWSASLAQTSLTVVWSLLGVVGWVVGSRRHQRGLWLAGAVLMALVLAKLVLVDRQHLGNLLGIGSFLAYGLLCTVVGYLAPAPPRDVLPVEEGVP